MPLPNTASSCCPVTAELTAVGALTKVTASLALAPGASVAAADGSTAPVTACPPALTALPASGGGRVCLADVPLPAPVARRTHTRIIVEKRADCASS